MIRAMCGSTKHSMLMNFSRDCGKRLLSKMFSLLSATLTINFLFFNLT
jgi:hypothetical protein